MNGNKANGSVLGEGGGVYYKSDSSFIHVNTNVKANKATIKGNDIFKGT
jgi:hypothetical protein